MFNLNVGDWILGRVNGERCECVIVGSHVQDDGRQVYRVKAPYTNFPSQIRNVFAADVFAKINKR